MDDDNDNDNENEIEQDNECELLAAYSIKRVRLMV